MWYSGACAWTIAATSAGGREVLEAEAESEGWNSCGCWDSLRGCEQREGGNDNGERRSSVERGGEHTKL